MLLLFLLPTFGLAMREREDMEEGGHTITGTVGGGRGRGGGGRSFILEVNTSGIWRVVYFNGCGNAGRLLS